MAAKYSINPGIFGVSAQAVRNELESLDICEGLDISVTGGEMTASVSVTCEAETEEEAASRCGQVSAYLRKQYGKNMYTETHGTLWNTVVAEFSEKEYTFALAESCTGGLISKMVTDIPGASSAFKLGVVAYDPEAKKKILGVNGTTIEEHGVVSGETAAEMAEGVRKAGDCTVGVGVTGLAGPGGGDNRYPEGTVFVALSDGRAVYLRRLNIAHSNRGAVRRAATLHALDMMRLYIEGHMDTIGVIMPMPSFEPVAAAKPKKEKQSLGKRFIRFFTDFPKDPLGEKFRKVVLCASVCLMLFAGYKVGTRVYDNINYDITQNKIGDMINIGSSMTDEEKQNIIDDLVSGGVIEEGQKISDWALGPIRVNNDLVGRIQIPLSDGSFLIDQIVVQGYDNDHYLKTNFFGESNPMGTVFMDYRCDKNANSVNTILYGHSTPLADRMFNPLHRYKELSFLNENPVINYSTISEDGQYKIFAVMIINTLPRQGEVYNGCYYTGSYVIEHLDEFRERSLYDTNVDVVEGDKILTLSTCSYELDELRLIVMARKVREGESIEVEPASINPDPVFFRAWYEKEEIEPPVGSETSSDVFNDTSSDESSETSSDVGDETQKRFEILDMALYCAEATADKSTYVKGYVPYFSEYDNTCIMGIITQPEHGKATIRSSENSVTYTPKVGFTGVDTFTVDLNDGTGLRYDTATVTVYVGVPKQMGVTLNTAVLGISAKAGKSGSCNIKATSETGSKLTYTILSYEGLFSGTAVVDEDGKVTYTSTSDQRWADTIKVMVADENGFGQMVVINVNSGYEFEEDAHINVSRPVPEESVPESSKESSEQSSEVSSEEDSGEDPDESTEQNDTESIVSEPDLPADISDTAAEIPSE